MILKKLTKTSIVAITMITAQSYAVDFKCEALIKECSPKLSKYFLKKVEDAKKACSNVKFSVAIQGKLVKVVTNKKPGKVYVFDGN